MSPHLVDQKVGLLNFGPLPLVGFSSQLYKQAFGICRGMLSASHRGRGESGKFESTKVLVKQEPTDLSSNSFNRKRRGRPPGNSSKVKDDLSLWPVFQGKVKEAEIRVSRRKTAKTDVKSKESEISSPSKGSWKSPRSTGDIWIDAIHNIPYSTHDMTEDDIRLFSLFPPEDFLSFLHPQEEFDMPDEYS